jgi:DNA ligase 1
MNTFTRRRFVAHVALGALVLPGWRHPAAAKPAAFNVVLAQDYKPGTDPRGYLVSEKLDGVRAFWDGKLLRFRSGRTIAAPAWFLAKLPPKPLDGELWLARGQFDVLSGSVRKATPVDSEWQQLKYMVFELPEGRAAAASTFAERARKLRDVVQAAKWPQLQAVDQFLVADTAALQAKLTEVVNAGGEGLVLHRADAHYTTGRSPALLKLKPQLDAEATVVGHVPGNGKFEGMLGALDVKTPEGVRFRIGTGLTDNQRRSPPPVGSTVTYTYRDKTPQGVPRFASFQRVFESN